MTENQRKDDLRQFWDIFLELEKNNYASIKYSGHLSAFFPEKSIRFLVKIC
jgi:hypothetical protein